MSKKLIKENPISEFGDNGKIHPKKGYVAIEAKDIKVLQLNPETVKDSRNIYLSWINQDGVEFVMYPNGSRGLRLTFEDGTKRYYVVSKSGKIQLLREYKGTFYVEDWKRKFDRFFGISDEMWHTKSWKINLIHALMFIGFSAVAVGLTGIIAWVIRGLIGGQ